MSAKLTLLALGALGAALVASISGCKTEAYCFANCDGEDAGVAPGTGGNGGGLGLGGEGGCLLNCGPATGTGGCTPTNNGVEKCDDLDNDCDGTIDQGAAIDFSDPHDCGKCGNNCYAQLQHVDPETITCDPGGSQGTEAGTCLGECSTDYHTVDPDKPCAYYCVKTADDDTVCNGKDDDCDGPTDENVDICTDANNCGKCGKTCVVLHGTPKCTHTGNDACDTGNTKCEIDTCHCVPGDCWTDLDGQYQTGCEYQCEATGAEVCGDGIDNDCDGLVDAADPDVLADPQVGQPCYGGALGICHDLVNVGVTQCQGNQVVCTGNIVNPGEHAETCNGVDDDCDGATDDAAAGVGDTCDFDNDPANNNFPCSPGVKQCIGGMLKCIGAAGPQTEICNGQDDNCDGNIDLTGASPPADSVGACDVPPAAPVGGIEPCHAGTKACQGGTVVCVGSALPQAATDACGVDSNCDGSLTNQPDLLTDVNHCGSCATDCYAGAVHSSFACVNGGCVFQGCLPGYFDPDGDQKCDYSCTFIQAQEICNDIDENCNGQKDEGVVTPSAVQVCGVSPAAIRPECKSPLVQVSCTGGQWTCQFPAGVCPGGCSSNDELCDNLDNDCDGGLNENVANFGQPCASDDGLPPPGDGACRTTGTFTCATTTTTTCSATKADCNSLVGGCTELCDGIDNDCDGTTDEPFTNKGLKAQYYVSPAVVKIGGSGPYMYAYEASRPTAKADSGGSGNGYFSAAPVGEPLDKTVACSAAGVIPWNNVTPLEVEQSCSAMGGRVCNTTEFKRGCRVDNNDGAGPNTPDTDNGCRWGYDPLGAACTTTADYLGQTKFCNLGGYDVNAALAGDQDGMLPTKSPLLAHCKATWNGYNNVVNQSLYDVTGNLREITRCQVDRAVCGTDAAVCAVSCCSGTSTATTYPLGNYRLCGAQATNLDRRLTGQACKTNAAISGFCCASDVSCNQAGACVPDSSGGLYCAAAGSAASCRTKGVACSTNAQCCGGTSCVGGLCGGPGTLPHAVYPAMGGSFATVLDDGATCDFDFYKVSETFKLYDTGFRCCFDSNPN